MGFEPTTSSLGNRHATERVGRIVVVERMLRVTCKKCNPGMLPRMETSGSVAPLQTYQSVFARILQSEKRVRARRAPAGSPHFKH